MSGEAKSKVPIQFRVQIDVGDGKTVPPKSVAAEVTRGARRDLGRATAAVTVLP
jgi:hypothetical protein